MSADLTIFAINSLVRLGQTGIDAFEEAARNEAILFPALVGIELNTETRLTEFFNSPENRAYVRDADAPYKDYWVFDGQNSMPKSDIRSIDALLIAATRIAASRGRTYVSTNAGPAGVLVKTWNEGQGPLSPVARIALVGADIVLEYVGNNPGIIGGGNGAKLISAYATTLSKSLPDDGKLSQKDKFKEAITGTMLRAGFDTLSKHADWVASEDHLVKLIESTVEPLLSAFPVETDSQVIEFDNLTKTLMGPVANALLSTVAENQTEFLGDKYAPETALGSMTKALFLHAKTIGLEDQFTKEGLISLFQASIGVVAANPDLFLDSDGTPKDQLAIELLQKFTGVLSTADYPFNRQVGIDLAREALMAVNSNIDQFVTRTGPWQDTAVNLLKTLLTQLTPLVGESGALKKVFSKQQLTEFGRIILVQISRSPSMIIKHQNALYSGIISTMASAMAADDKLMLSADDWLKIVEVVAKEAATNPMRLFNLDPANPDDVLAGKLIVLMLDAAKEFAQTQGDKSVLFGETLSEAINILIRASSGNVKAATDKLDDIRALMSELNTFVANKEDQYGSKEILRVFRILVQQEMADLNVPQLTVDFVNSLLAGAN